jgi:magnesium chelatase family protein
MYCKVISGAVLGIEVCLVEVEICVNNGFPCFEMVGYLSSEVKEAKERVTVSIMNSGIPFPPKHVTINISPAHIRKSGTAFELPIAVGLLIGLGIVSEQSLEDCMVMGEIGLDGKTKFTQAVLPTVLEAKKRGIKYCLVPEENAKEGGIVEGIEVIGIKELNQLIWYLQAEKEKRKQMIEPTRVSLKAMFLKQDKKIPYDFLDVTGQKATKRAVEIAAAGFHNLIMTGPPGTGKTMIAKRIPYILPPLSIEESLEVSKIYSVAGLLSKEKNMVTSRPFLNPHHTISERALAGGGRNPKPGVISLAHRGILFLDELPEFKRSTLEVLRQPMEDKKILISRINGNLEYPANFMLVAAMNPCPCGFYPDRNLCHCKDYEIKRYQNRISGALLDRIDIATDISTITLRTIEKDEKNERSEKIRDRVMEARMRQAFRYRKTTITYNADLSPTELSLYCKLDDRERKFMEEVYETLNLSVRAYHKVLKVARTIADLDGKDKINRNHLSEAIGYRKRNRIDRMGGETIG